MNGLMTTAQEPRVVSASREIAAGPVSHLAAGQPRRVPETVVVVFGQVGSLKRRVVIAGGRDGWPRKH